METGRFPSDFGRQGKIFHANVKLIKLLPVFFFMYCHDKSAMEQTLPELRVTPSTFFVTNWKLFHTGIILFFCVYTSTAGSSFMAYYLDATKPYTNYYKQ